MAKILVALILGLSVLFSTHLTVSADYFDVTEHMADEQ